MKAQRKQQQETTTQKSMCVEEEAAEEDTPESRKSQKHKLNLKLKVLNRVLVFEIFNSQNSTKI
jgi:hypothetical protein